MIRVESSEVDGIESLTLFTNDRYSGQVWIEGESIVDYDVTPEEKDAGRVMELLLNYSYTCLGKERLKAEVPIAYWQSLGFVANEEEGGLWHHRHS
jgi:hypothetical protein